MFDEQVKKSRHVAIAPLDQHPAIKCRKYDANLLLLSSNQTIKCKQIHNLRSFLSFLLRDFGTKTQK